MVYLYAFNTLTGPGGIKQWNIESWGVPVNLKQVPAALFY
jgi:hypothetical protein